MSSENQLPSPEQVSIPPEIQNAARLGKLAFFIGNGISRLYGLPSWEELCTRMLRGLATHKVINHNKVELLGRQSLKARISIADHYFKNLKEGSSEELTYKYMLYQGLDESHKKRVSAYSSLAKCGVKFITTNYDSLLYEELKGLAQVNEPIQNIKVDGQYEELLTVDKSSARNVQFFGDPLKFSRVDSLHNNVLFHLHGSINDEKTIVASTWSYLKLYSDPNVRSFLNWFFKNHVVVFLGYGLEELELLDLIVRAGTQDEGGGAGETSFYLLLPLLSHEAEILGQLQIYYSQLGINILPFSRDEKDFVAYADLIELWSGELAQTAKEPTRVEDLNLIDSLVKEFEGNPNV